MGNKNTGQCIKTVYAILEKILASITDIIQNEQRRNRTVSRSVKTVLAMQEQRNNQLTLMGTPVVQKKPHIRKTSPWNVYPLTPRFYIAKLGYAGVYLFFLSTIDVLSENKKNIKSFLTKIFNFYNLRKICTLHRHVFVMRRNPHGNCVVVTDYSMKRNSYSRTTQNYGWHHSKRKGGKIDDAFN